jgi:hypothetical protein
MKRFFNITDEIPEREQRRLPVNEGGRGHPFLRREFTAYRNAFDYSYFMMSKGAVSRNQEIRYL